MNLIAIDQSYKRTGVAVIKNDKLVLYKCVSFNNKNKKEVRQRFIDIVRKLDKCYKPDFYVVERIRLFSRGFLAMKTILSLGSLIYCVVDNVNKPVYSVDTRSWKYRVLGSAKCDKKDAVKFVKSKGYNVKHHDTAEAICIALYAMKYKDMLKEENI